MTNPLTMLSLIVIIPFLGMLFVLTSKDDNQQKIRNSSSTAIFTILSNIIMIWQIFAVTREGGDSQLVEKLMWFKYLDINMVFAVDNMSLLLILAVHIITLCGIVFVPAFFREHAVRKLRAFGIGVRDSCGCLFLGVLLFRLINKSAGCGFFIEKPVRRKVLINDASGKRSCTGIHGGNFAQQSERYKHRQDRAKCTSEPFQERSP